MALNLGIETSKVTAKDVEPNTMYWYGIYDIDNKKEMMFTHHYHYLYVSQGEFVHPEDAYVAAEKKCEELLNEYKQDPNKFIKEYEI